MSRQNIKSKCFINLISASFLVILIGLVVSFNLSCTSTGSGKNENFAAKNQYRPKCHFTPDSMWMNDPNGLVYLNGEYHLFYQYNPDSTVWGPMHWGHAVSKDLVHWQHLPIALFPDSLGYIFSGSAVVDNENTSGFGKKGQPALVAIYTYHDIKGERAGRNDFQSQGIAYSNDNGRTWTKYKKNPVLKSPGQRDFRDPKVIWYKENHKWIMTLACGDHICFYSSPNLKEWTFESEFGKSIGAHGGVWECPDLFELEVTGDISERKWVLLVSTNPGGPSGGSATQYFVGEFDGHKFVNESKRIRWIDYGKDNYAGVTYSNIPESDGRRILIGWMSNWQYAQVVPTSNWRGAMTFPRQLSLIKNANGYTLISMPVEEIQLLRKTKKEIGKATVINEKPLEIEAPTPPFPLEIIVQFGIPVVDTAGNFGIELYNDKNEKVIIGFDVKQSRFYINRSKIGINDFSKEFAGIHFSDTVQKEPVIDFHLLVDATSVELFAMNGKVVMTDIYFPITYLDKIRIIAENGGNIKVDNMIIYKLTPALDN